MKTLKELLATVKVVSLAGKKSSLDMEIKGLTSDSRRAEKGMVFVALAGTDQDGHKYVGDALAKGCTAIVVEKEMEVQATAVVRVNDSHRAYGLMAAELYGHPGREMTVIGLTGTNGKTTTSWIIEKMLRERGGKVGVIGTINYRYNGRDGESIVMDAPLTTPEPAALQHLLREMADSGVTDVVMEVSSHALSQQRLAGLTFDIGVFTNLSRDHLDYHATMEQYFASKSRLFLEYLKEDGVAVVVHSGAHEHGDPDGKWDRSMVALLRDNGFLPYTGKRINRSYLTCGFDRDCTIRAAEPVQNLEGSTCRIFIKEKSLHLKSQLIGRYNILNMLAAAAVGHAAGLEIDAIGRGLGTVTSIPGRLERVALPSVAADSDDPYVFVDYAHTPDALENVLQTLRQMSPGRLICIFGCGGNRDRGKRPLMGEIAGRLADRVLVTSDNPRKEDPAAILQEIESGLCRMQTNKTEISRLLDKSLPDPQYAVLEDRRQAIHMVCSQAEKNDVVLIAGKGHETYQITARGKRFFDDRLEARNGRLRWTADHLCRATSGSLDQQGAAPLLGEVSTDTRTLRPGDIFLALQGENFDGHGFAPEAIRKGAAALIISESCPAADSSVCVVRVKDTLRALGDLAGYRRRALAPGLLVIGITGSSGKTTVKEMTAAVLEEHYKSAQYAPVLKTRGNFNNLVGLPLTLLEINAGHRAAVLEMGMNRPGEIKRLAEIAAPDIGCITNVQAAHLEGLGTIEGVARAKKELFTAMSPGGVRIVNYDDVQIKKSGEYHGNTVIGFAVTPAGRKHNPAVKATRISSQGAAGMCFTLHVNNWRKRIQVPAAGAHNVANCAAAAAIATAAGVHPEVIVRGLSRFRSGDKRLQVSVLPGGIHVLNDSYNANPSSMAAALRTISDFGCDCGKIAVLGDMLELGDASADFHRQIGSLVGELGFQYLAVTGSFSGMVIEGARKTGMGKNKIMAGESADAIAHWLAGLIAKKKIHQGDWLLVKGSRGMRMEKVLESLAEHLKKEQ
ncbi:MAG: UDP-N-acetylmuramoyl-L-alanyl-D-glutamate--2,6-diaminopimelate ligase [Desulfobulbaceae bacterium]|nr:UDP-N-acetylmuramoyl-L-alanyl-D-glutamate--2,6-diaminopimelate ligase [Desulfobulbaceae bacterium]